MAKSTKKLMAEVDAMLGRKKSKRVKAHAPVRSTCEICLGPHSTASHRSHGRGSFERTHGESTFRLGREVHLAGAEDILAVLDAPRRRKKR